jgi:hypothetical protein
MSIFSTENRRFLVEFIAYKRISLMNGHFLHSVRSISFRMSFYTCWTNEQVFVACRLWLNICCRNSWGSLIECIYRLAAKVNEYIWQAWKTHEFLLSVGVRTSVSLWVQAQRGYGLVWVDGKLDPCEILMPLSGWNLSGSGCKSFGSGWKSLGRVGVNPLGLGENP